LQSPCQIGRYWPQSHWKKIIIGPSGHRAVITGALSDECRDVQAAKIPCDREKFRNGCVVIRGAGTGGSGVKTEAARDVAISKSFSAGARIAKWDANNLFTSLSNIKAMQKQLAKCR
jgi:hypothetical protein